MLNPQQPAFGSVLRVVQQVHQVYRGGRWQKKKSESARNKRRGKEGDPKDASAKAKHIHIYIKLV